jgi:D-alanine-D-alanine ligase
MTIGVLRGGMSPHYDLSLATGRAVSEALRDKYLTRDLFIDIEGKWHFEGMPTSPSKLVSHIDVFWNALHGGYGEDGGLQRDMDNLGAKYTGPGATPARFAWRKDLSKKILRESQVPTPESISVKHGDDLTAAARQAFRLLGGQYVVKPAADGHSRGVFFVPTFRDLAEVLRVALEEYDHILVEEAVHGKELKCLVARGFRGEDYYSFLPLEIHKGSSVGIYKPTQTDDLQAYVPARISPAEKTLAMDTARDVHRAFDLGDYSFVDMIMAPRGIVVLEADPLPYLGPGSLVARSLEAVGSNQVEFFHHVALRSSSL